MTEFEEELCKNKAWELYHKFMGKVANNWPEIAFELCEWMYETFEMKMIDIVTGREPENKDDE